MADIQPQSSFIPKKSMSGGVLSQSGGLFPFIANLIFVVAIISSISVFGYEKYLQNRISKMHDDLSSARASLEPNTIHQLTEADKRIIAARDIINNHVTLSALFEHLESITLQNLRFTSFAYAPGDTKNITVTMKGQARSYALVALQAKIFAEDTSFVNPQFSNLDLDDKGNVVFTLKTGIDPKSVSYIHNQNFEHSEVALPPVSQTTNSTSTASSTP